MVRNTIFWADSASYHTEINSDESSSPQFTYCNIADTVWAGDGNISADPFFRDPDNGDYHLMSTACGDPSNSPCIDAGDPSIFDYLLDCDGGLGGRRSDMGAYGGQAVPTDIRDGREPEIPMICGLLQNYPNPFNATTFIRYNLPSASNVRIDLYDLLGRVVETLVDERQPAGYHRIRWEAGNLPTGIYFYRIKAGRYSYSGSCLLLK